MFSQVLPADALRRVLAPYAHTDRVLWGALISEVRGYFKTSENLGLVRSALVADGMCPPQAADEEIASSWLARRARAWGYEG